MSEEIINNTTTLYSNDINSLNTYTNNINIQKKNIDINIMSDKIDLQNINNLMQKFNEFYNNKSKNDNITCIEIPNLHKLNFILKNQNEINKLNYLNVVSDAIGYKSILKKKSNIKVTYKNNKGIRRKMSPTMNSTTMSRNLRNFIFDDIIDLDMKNSAVCVIINLIEIYDLGEFPILYEILTDKSNFLIENDISKNDLVSILNGGFKNKSDKVILFCNEINNFYDKIRKIDNFTDLFKSCQNHINYENKKNNENKTVKNSFLSWVYQSVETKILDLCCEFLSEYDIHSLEYDGVKIRTNKFDKLDELNNYIKLKSGLNIEFIQKEMEIDEILNKYFIDNYKEQITPILTFDTDKFLITFDNVTKDGFLKVSELLAEELTKNVKYCNKKWIGCKNNLWITFDNILTFISKQLHLGIKEYTRLIYLHIELYKQYYNTDKYTLSEMNTLIMHTETIISKIENSAFLNHINKCLITLLTDNDFENKLDRNSYCIAFKNGIFDVRNNKFRYGILQNDYLSKTLDFDYNDTFHTKNIDNIKHELYKICNCDTLQLNYFLSHISYMLCGDPSINQYFYFCVGQLSGNGKSFIFDLLSELMPCYVKKLNSQILEEDFSKKHKFLPAFGKYRIIYLNEMKARAKIDAKIFKEIADGSTLNNEIMYGCESVINILGKAVLISNHTPVFDNADEGVNRRMKITQHNSQFRENILQDDYENKIFIENKHLDKKILTDWKNDFIHLILQEMNKYYLNGFPETPEIYLEEISQIKDTNDDFKNWFEENIQINNKTDKKGKLSCAISKFLIKEKIEEDLKTKFTDSELRDNFKKYKLKYDKTVCVDNKRGGWRGISWKQLYFNKYESENSDSDSD